MKKFMVNKGCTFCGTCVFECPENAIVLDAEGAHIDQEKCNGCGTCYDNCASEAISNVEANNSQV